MIAYTLTFPYPISANRYWRQTARGVYVSPEAMDYKTECGWIARLNGLCEPLTCRAAVSLTLHPKLPADWRVRVRKDAAWAQSVRCQDLDNIVKVSLDALNGIAYADDSQIWRLMVERGEPVIGGGLVVSIRPYEETGR